MTNEFDIVIVGGGAAGIGAARGLAGHGRSILLIEARDRIGGRAHSARLGDAMVDLGCGYLHSAERNGWANIAGTLGFAVDRRDPGWSRQYRNLGFPEADQHDAWMAFERFSDRLRQDPPASDRAADALVPGGRWNAYIEALSGYINGTEFAEVSVRDYIAYDNAASDRNWRVCEGLGALIAASLPGAVTLRLDTPVIRIDHGGRRLRLDTPAGAIVTDRVVVAVPTTVLASGALAFTPKLHTKREAAAALPLGLADKLFLAVANPDNFPRDAHLLGNPHRAETGSYQLQPMGLPVVEAFFGGRAARDLEAAGAEGMADFALDELAGLLGSDIRRQLHPLGGSAWGKTSWIEGGYSHARPGRADQRAALARPVDGRIFFAGEACSPSDFSTAHGALDTGMAAAAAVLGSLAV
jgi:monoamine oxidase